MWLNKKSYFVIQAPRQVLLLLLHCGLSLGEVWYNRLGTNIYSSGHILQTITGMFLQSVLMPTESKHINDFCGVCILKK